MIDIVLVTLGALLVLCLSGLCVLWLVPARSRGVLLPALPALGVVALAIPLCLAGAFVAVSTAVWWALACVLALGAIGLVWRRSWRLGSRRDVIALVNSGLLGVLYLLLVLTPLLVVGQATMIQTEFSYDGFYYVSVADWLTDHPATEAPHLGQAPGAGIDPPVFGPALETWRFNLRVGQESLVAALAVLLGRTPIEVQFILMGVWSFLIPGGTVVLARALGLRQAGGLVLGAALLLSYPFITQVLRPNADSVLGIALIPLALGVVIRIMRSPGSRTAPPLWLAGAIIAAVIGIYTEYLPFLGAVLICITVFGAPRQTGRRLLLGLAIVGWSVVLGPLLWWRAGQSVLFLLSHSTAAADSVSGLRIAVFFDPVRGMLGHLLALPGTRLLLAAAAVVAVIALAGLVAAIVSSATRPLALGSGLAVGLLAVMSRTADDYVLSRARDIVLPLVVCVAVLGAEVLGRWLAWKLSGRLPRVVVATTGWTVIAGVLVLVAIPAVRFVAFASKSPRIVSADYARVTEWADDYSLAVAAPVLFEQLWLTQALQDHGNTEYVSLRGDLGYRSNFDLRTFGDGAGTDAVIVGYGAHFTDEAAVLDRTSEFTLVDPRRTAIAAPLALENHWTWDRNPEGGIASTGPDVIFLLGDRGGVAATCLSFDDIPVGSTLTLASGSGSVDVPVLGPTVDVPVAELAEPGTSTRVRVSVTGPESTGGFVWKGLC